MSSPVEQRLKLKQIHNITDHVNRTCFFTGLCNSYLKCLSIIKQSDLLEIDSELRKYTNHQNIISY